MSQDNPAIETPVDPAIETPIDPTKWGMELATCAWDMLNPNFNPITQSCQALIDIYMNVVKPATAFYHVDSHLVHPKLVFLEQVVIPISAAHFRKVPILQQRAFPQEVVDWIRTWPQDIIDLIKCLQR